MTSQIRKWDAHVRQTKYFDYTVLFLAFIALNLLLPLISPPNHTFKNLPWYWRVATQLHEWGLFAIWTPYPPLFSLYIYLLTTFFNEPEVFFLAWKLLNLAMILMIGFLIYQIKVKNERTALVSAFGYMIINLTLTSAITIGYYFDQYDYLAVLCMMTSLYLLVSNRVSGSAILCGIGTMIKIFPGAILPIALVVLDKPMKQFKYFGFFALACATTVLPWLIANPGALRSFYEFSASRDAWETIWTFPELKFPPIPRPESFVLPFHADANPYPWLNWIAGATGLGYLWWKRNSATEMARPRMLLALLLILLIFSKGISSYYIYWVFPLLFVIYKPLCAFVACGALLLVGAIEFVSSPIEPVTYWISIFARHIIFLGLLIQTSFDWSIAKTRIATADLSHS